MITIDFTIEEINLVLRALAEMPYRVSAPLIDKIRTEGNKQFEELQNKAE